MFWLGLVLPISYVPGVTDLDILSGWIVLSLALPFFFLHPIRLGIAHYLGLAFLGYAILSFLWAPVWQQGVWDLWLLGLLAGCFCLGSEYEDLRPLWKGLALGMGVNLVVALIQVAGYHPVYANQAHYPPGLFYNPDMLGESAALITAVLIATRLYPYLILTIPCIFLSGSRNALLALCIILTAPIWQRWRWKGVSTAAFAITLLVAGTWHPSNLSGPQERFAIWADTASGLTPFGRGPGSFFMLYPEFAHRTDTMLTRPEDPHNDYLQLAFQYGLGALPLVALLAIGLMAGGSWLIPLLAFCSIAFFSFPQRIPIEGLVGMAALGSCLRSSTMAWRNRTGWRPVRTAWAKCLGSQGVPVESVYPNSARV